MIVFDLACGEGHVFEAWFGSSADFEAQRARDLVACPLCGSPEVAKAVMAPAVGAKGNQVSTTVPVRAGDPPPPAAMKAMLAALAQAQAKALASSEHVGERFVAEARAMHDGDAPQRQIHGRASIAEAKALVDDGISIAPLPFPVVPPDALQ